MTIPSDLVSGHESDRTSTMATLKDLDNYLYLLLDIGCSKLLKNLFKKIKNNYATAIGLYKVNEKSAIAFKLLDFFSSKKIAWYCDVDGGSLTEPGYDMIFGLDLLKA